jgi:hypothetical protein
MFVEPPMGRTAIWRRMSVRVTESRRVGGTTVRAWSLKESSDTMSPSLSLRTIMAAAARAFWILSPAIEPEVSMTSATCIGGRASGRASGTSTQTPRKVSRVSLERIPLADAAPTHEPSRLRSAGSVAWTGPDATGTPSPSGAFAAASRAVMLAGCAPAFAHPTTPRIAAKMSALRMSCPLVSA